MTVPVAPSSPPCPGARFAALPEAGMLMYHSSLEAVIDLFAAHVETEMPA